MPFYCKKRSFYQDRLGTNMGKALQKTRVFSLKTAGALGMRVTPNPGGLAALVAAVEAKAQHIDSGIVGTKHIFDALSYPLPPTTAAAAAAAAAGSTGRGESKGQFDPAMTMSRADLALAIVSQKTYPGAENAFV
jgi:hypothetical protein